MPRNTWSDPVAYDRQAHQLAELFKKNFAQFELTDSVVAAGLRQVASGSSRPVLPKAGARACASLW